MNSFDIRHKLAYFIGSFPVPGELVAKHFTIRAYGVWTWSYPKLMEQNLHTLKLVAIYLIENRDALHDS